MIASDTLFDSSNRLLGTSYPMKTNMAISQTKNEDSRNCGSQGRSHGNNFWDYISCKCIQTGDNDVGI